MKKIPTTSLIQLEINKSVAKITLTRSDKYNAMNIQMISELNEVFAWTAKHSVGKQNSLTDNEGYLSSLVMVNTSALERM